MWIIRSLAIVLAVILASAPAFAQEAQRLQQHELEALQKRQTPKLPQTRGGSPIQPVTSLSKEELSQLRLVRTETRIVHNLEELRAGDVETGLSTVYWVLIGVGIAAGVVILITLILIFTI